MPTNQSGLMNNNHIIEFYYMYIAHAFPPLDCDWIRLMGISAIFDPMANDASWRYSHATKEMFAAAYSLETNRLRTNPAIPLGSDIQAQLDRCNFEKIKINDARYYVPDSLPRAFLIENMDSKTIERISGLHDFSITQKTLTLGDDTILPITPVNISIHNAENISITSNPETAGLLVITNSFNPNWRAKINGIPVKVGKAFTLFQSIQVPKGENNIEIRYEPINSLHWKVMPLVGLILLMLIGRVARKFRSC